MSKSPYLRHFVLYVRAAASTYFAFIVMDALRWSGTFALPVKLLVGMLVISGVFAIAAMASRPEPLSFAHLRRCGREK